MRLRLRPAARIAAIALAPALVLTACARPGTAATVDGVRITDSELATVVSDFERLGLTTDAQNALTAIVSTGPLLDAAGDLGLAVSREQGIDLLDQIAISNGAEPFDYSEAMIDIARRSLLVEQVTSPEDQAVLVEAVDQAQVSVNPRFGTFDPLSGISTTQWPWIVGSDTSAVLG